MSLTKLVIVRGKGSGWVTRKFWKNRFIQNFLITRKYSWSIHTVNRQLNKRENWIMKKEQDNRIIWTFHEVPNSLHARIEMKSWTPPSTVYRKRNSGVCTWVRTLGRAADLVMESQLRRPWVLNVLSVSVNQWDCPCSLCFHHMHLFWGAPQTPLAEHLVKLAIAFFSP